MVSFALSPRFRSTQECLCVEVLARTVEVMNELRRIGGDAMEARQHRQARQARIHLRAFFLRFGHARCRVSRKSAADAVTSVPSLMICKRGFGHKVEQPCWERVTLSDPRIAHTVHAADECRWIALTAVIPQHACTQAVERAARCGDRAACDSAPYVALAFPASTAAI